MKSIKVSEQMHQKLSELKDDEGHTSYDSVIRALVREYEQ